VARTGGRLGAEAPARLMPPDLTSRVIATASLQAHALLEHTVPYWPLDQIHRLQRARLRSIVDHAYSTVPFYREAMDARGLRPGDFRRVEDLQRLPLIDATFVQENLDRFLSRASAESDREEFHTSGSESGVRRTIYWDSPAVVRTIAYLERVLPAVEHLARERAGSKTLRMAVGESRAQSLRRRVGRESRTLLILPGDDPAQTRAGMLSRRTLMPARAAHVHYLSSRLPPDAIVRELNAVRPRIVSSFGSVAEQFLRFLADSGARPALPRVWTYTGDAVSRGGRELAERFGCSLHSSYNTTEVGRIGFQCERLGGYHLNVDIAPVHLIDPEGRPVSAGEPGEIVTSGLRNRAMVLLNYRLDDRGVMGQARCGCGRTLPVLERLEGRRSSVLRLGDGRELSALTLESMFRRELEPTLKVQLEERAVGRLHWRIVPFSDVDQGELRGTLTERARQVLGPQTRLTIEFVDEIHATEGGKLRRALTS
jgi:phenylacetate-CoA ligase